MTRAGTAENSAANFEGFTHLDANFLYCPNQFLDLCLPHCSRGVVRLVAYMLDQTLGWLDSDGHPISQDITVSYRQLSDAAGISRGAIRTALNESIAAGFIHCLHAGRPATSGTAAEQATYALRWDTRPDYQNSPETFQGFFAGEGHRTPIPNAFFRQIIPQETLLVTKVVGTVLRHTVGYQNQFGGRRSEAPLSYRFIQNFAGIPDPKSLHRAILSAIASNYIVCVEQGTFHPDPAERRPASYAVRWLRINTPAISGSKLPVGEQFINPSSVSVQKSQQEQFINPSRNGSKNPSAERSRIASNDKTVIKNTYKQQDVTPAVAVENMEALQLLLSVGFDSKIAAELSHGRGVEEIQNQITWLAKRNIERNRLGMLRRAIEQNWREPSMPISDQAHKAIQRNHEDETRNVAESAVIAERTERRREERRSRLMQWRSLDRAERERLHKLAIKEADSQSLRRLLLGHTNLSDPPSKTLDVMARSLATAARES